MLVKDFFTWGLSYIRNCQQASELPKIKRTLLKLFFENEITWNSNIGFLIFSFETGIRAFIHSFYTGQAVKIAILFLKLLSC